MSKNSTISAVLAAAALLIAGPPAKADLTGHTDLGVTGLWSGTNNWSVISDFGDTLLVADLVAKTGDLSLATTAGDLVNDYYYLFQPTNDPGSTVPLVSFTTSLGIGPNIVAGTYDVLMVDAGGSVSPGNDLGSPLLGFAAGLGSTTAPSSWGVLGGSVAATYGTVPLPAGGTSELLVYVSSNPPGSGLGSLQDGGAAVFGFSPAPIPAPGAVLLGMIGLGVVGWVKRRTA